MPILPSLVFVLVGSFLWAKLEIQIEGKDGWAANLPTWRIEKHLLLDILYGGRPLTGYHVWAFLFVFFFFHFPFIALGTWSFRGELQLIGFYDVFWVVEDFLWFILNPHYGWKTFSKKFVWWHRRWVLGLPLDYWVLGIIGLTLIFLPFYPR